MKSTLSPYLVQIRQHDPAAVRQLYADNLPNVVSYVCRNQGSPEQAKDIFQDAVLILYDKLQQEDFEIKGDIGGYLYGICRFLWMRSLKKKQQTPITSSEKEGLTIDPAWESSQIQEKKWGLFQEHFSKLGKDCQQVLKLFFAGQRLAVIAEQMGYTNTYVKLKKFQCKERLTKWVQADRRYASLK